MKLTPKQEAFCNKYLECGNASEAYRFAYDVGEDTSIESIHVNASKVLNNDKVALRISNLQKELALESKITREFIIQKYLDLINMHSGYKDKLTVEGVMSGKDKEKIYTMSNSGYYKGSDVNTALQAITKMMGLDKEQEKKQEAQTINNIQINIKRDRD